MQRLKYDFKITEVINKEHWEKELSTKYIAPCGHEFYKEHTTIEQVKTEHCQKCDACLILSGNSHKTVTTQDNVATLFGFGIDDLKSSSGNFSSENGILTHYNTIEAIRTADNKIIQNRECWAGRFAHCSHPKNIDYSLDLTTLDTALNPNRWVSAAQQELRLLKVIDVETVQIKTEYGEYKNDIAYLIQINDRYFVNGENVDSPKSTRYIVELNEPCKTMKEAYESMKPKAVKEAESRGLKVQRQGELFFIPITETLTPFKPSTVNTRTNKMVTVYYGECKMCGHKSAESTDSDAWELTKHVSHWDSQNQKERECAANDIPDSEKMVVKTRQKREFSKYPLIDAFTDRFRSAHHSATNTATENGNFYAIGKIRHTEGEHTPLKLEKWHVVIKNTVKQSLSSGGKGFRGYD